MLFATPEENESLFSVIMNSVTCFSIELLIFQCGRNRKRLTEMRKDVKYSTSFIKMRFRCLEIFIKPIRFNDSKIPNFCHLWFKISFNEYKGWIGLRRIYQSCSEVAMNVLSKSFGKLTIQDYTLALMFSHQSTFSVEGH